MSRSLTGRRADIDPHRVESRVAAYVYGDVLVLAAVIGASPHSITSGTAMALVLATVASTYVAHVLAHSIGVLFGGDNDHERAGHTLRDALPIISSGVVPAAVLLLAAAGLVTGLVGQAVAATVPLLRIAATGLIYRHLQDEVPFARAVWVGVLAAAVALLAVVIKLAVAH